MDLDTIANTAAKTDTDPVTESINGIALITGASSGIGRETALELARVGFHVKLIARTESALQAVKKSIETCGGSAEYLLADLQQEDEFQRISAWALKPTNALDVLVNNAGLAWYGYAEKQPWKVAREMLAVNVNALVRLTTLLLPSMKSNRKGNIINVSSIAGSIPSQGVALYSATKSFVDAFSTAVQRELVGTGVHLSVVRAGAVATPFFKKAANQPRGMRIPAQRLAISPQRVARRIVQLIERPRRIIYIPRILKLVPSLELTMGWLIDRIGPLLLKRADQPREKA